MKLVSGNINYSSWSIRAWYAMVAFDIPFELEVIPLYEPDSNQRIIEHSPSGRVPVLLDGDIVVWDSLAILEYLADKYLEKDMRPSSLESRAHMRSVCAEMHSGFLAIRSTLHTNMRARYPGYGHTSEVLKEVARIDEMWCACRQRYRAEGEFLFGSLSLADAMYAPMVSRFRTYGVALSPLARDYMDAMLDQPTMKQWDRLAEEEPYTIAPIEDDLVARGASRFKQS